MLRLAHTVADQRRGNDRAFREVLNGDAQSEAESTGHGDDVAAGKQTGQHHAYRHAFGQIVQRYRQHQHQGFTQTLSRTAFRLIGVDMQMRNGAVGSGVSAYVGRGQG